tara:strand:+ start:264 stop:569 length:306 start_codon:yes stop_codon:yes gene_type:complete
MSHKKEKLKRELLVGKLLDLIGEDKTTALLKECQEPWKQIDAVRTDGYNVPMFAPYMKEVPFINFMNQKEDVVEGYVASLNRKGLEAEMHPVTVTIEKREE